MNLSPSVSLQKLSHPLVLGALGLMALNDFVLKVFFPSWWTGKISDVCALILFPIVFSVFLQVLLGRIGWLQTAQRRLIPALVFAGSGVGFCLLKLSPAANQGLKQAFLALTGWQLQAVLDPTDLIALVGLLAAAWLWRRPLRVAENSVRLSWRWILLPVAATLLMADAARPDLGVACLKFEAGKIVVNSGFSSSDGGKTWMEESPHFDTCPSVTPGSTFEVPGKDNLAFQVTVGQGIRRSKDGGKTWDAGFVSRTLTQAEQVYVQKVRTSSLYYQPGPLDAVYDPASGNLVAAMGLEGVLLGDPNGGWTWVPVGPYRHEMLSTAGFTGYVQLLQFELLLSAMIGLAWFYTSLSRASGRFHWAWRILIWLAVACTAVVIHPEFVSSYLISGTIIGCLVSVPVVLILNAILVVVVRPDWGSLVKRLMTALAVALAVLMPYLLWGAGFLPEYWLAVGGCALLSLLLGVLLK